MTTRVGHSLGAMRRYIQMSRHRVFIYVEGRDLDRVFYGRLCGPILAEQGLSHEIIVADRIAGGGGGKDVLIRLFDYLRRRKALIDRSGPDAKLVMVYIDKDTDDVFRTMRRSPNLIYTRYYCAENELFCEGDLSSSIAIAGSLDPGIVATQIPDPGTWRRAAAADWRDWIVLCLSAQRLRMGGPATYSVKHDTTTSNVNATNIVRCEAELRARSGLSALSFTEVLGWAKRCVDRTFRRGDHDRLFKGKWYALFAMHELDRLAAAHGPINRNGAKDRLMGGLVASVPFDGLWSEHYRAPLRKNLKAL